jgi:hypothetical protein
MRYSYEVLEQDARRFRMGTTGGPLTMETTYTFAPGEPAGPGFLRPFVKAARRRANRRDLRDLRRRLEPAD